MLGKIKRLKDNCENKFIYPLTVSKAVYVNEEQNLQSKLFELDRKINEISLEDIIDIDFGAVKDRSTFSFEGGALKVVPDITNSYFFDLSKWEVSNTGEDAQNTSSKINEALQWASGNGYDEFVLPNGTYLIDENNPIIVPSRMTLNLGGARLRIRDNSLERYTIITIPNKSEYIRITNGELEGDRYNHDYDTVPGTHEWGMGISVMHHSRFIHIDYIHAFNFTGDCIYTEAIPNFIDMRAFDRWEQGSISTGDGSLITDSSRIRSEDFISIPERARDEYGFFNVCGNSFGDYGRDIESETFDIFFYDNNNDFLSVVQTVKVFDDIEVPEGAYKFKLSYYQSNLPLDEEGTALSLCISLCPRHVYIEKCDLHHSRRCGLVPTGKHIYVRDNKIHHIRGTSPGCAIDVEDGYGLNQNIRIYDNHLYDTRVGVAFVSTQYVHFVGNYMERLGPSTVWGECRQVHINQNIVRSSTWDLQGETLFHGNTLYHSSVSSRNKSMHIINDNFFYNSSLSVNKSLRFTSLVSDNYFCRDAVNTDISNNKSEFDTFGQPQIIQNNHFDKVRIYNFSDVNDWLFSNNYFKLITGSVAITLAPGTYKNCIFDCSNLTTPIQFRVNSSGYKYEYIDCDFKDVDFFASYNQPMELLRFDRCDIKSTKNRFFYFRDMNGVIEVTNNRFIMDSATGGTVLSLLASSFTSCEKILVTGNTFDSNGAPMEAMTLSQFPIQTFRFTDNTLENTILNPSNVNLTVYENIIDGVKDPYYIFNMKPTSGYFKYRQKVEKEVIQPGDYLGWICIKEGTANNTNWRPSTVYKVGDRVNVNEKVYEALSGGTTSSVAPNHSSGNMSDGGVTWSFISDLAVFKQYGKIEE